MDSWTCENVPPEGRRRQYGMQRFCFSLQTMKYKSCVHLFMFRSQGTQVFVWSDLIWFGLKLGGHGVPDIIASWTWCTRRHCINQGWFCSTAKSTSVSANVVGTGISSCFNISFRSTFLTASYAAVAWCSCLPSSFELIQRQLSSEHCTGLRKYVLYSSGVGYGICLCLVALYPPAIFYKCVHGGLSQLLSIHQRLVTCPYTYLSWLCFAGFVADLSRAYQTRRNIMSYHWWPCTHPSYWQACRSQILWRFLCVQWFNLDSFLTE